MGLWQCKKLRGDGVVFIAVRRLKPTAKDKVLIRAGGLFRALFG